MDRKVTSTKRDKAGTIVALCNPNESWSPRRTADVLQDISGGRRSYYVTVRERRRYLRVVQGSLQTTADESRADALETLPSG
jgi:hypothetical protein